MAAACSAALHVVGQKCCDDGTARLATFRAKRGLSALSICSTCSRLELRLIPPIKARRLARPLPQHLKQAADCGCSG